MKLVFPNGESDQVQLKPGKNSVGSSDGCDVVLKIPGIAAQHAEIELGPNGARIGVHDATNITRVNGTLVAARTPISPGDALLFANVQCQVAGDAPSLEQPAAPAAPAVEDAGATKVRMAIATALGKQEKSQEGSDQVQSRQGADLERTGWEERHHHRWADATSV